ncbi:MAG: RagB/SusD family nutrient uptake outer membrane protein [Gemmatimonadaceae bacterium]
MRNLFVKPSFRVASLATLLVAIPAMGAMHGCTDLEEVPTSNISPGNFYRTEAEIRGGLAGAYAMLRDGVQQGFWFASEVSSGEGLFPTRGSDWFDNGKWLELYRQTWAAGSAITNDDVNSAWNQLFTGVSRANVVLAAIEPKSIANKAAITAELRALRAFYYYLLMDLFGGVPIVTTPEVETRAASTRAQVFAFVEQELTAARADLPQKWPAADYGRITQGAADAILASLYLNAEVFSGTVTASGLTKGTARWADAVTAADRILNSGTYSLASNWQSNFSPTNESSPENIFVVRNTPAPGQGLTFINRSGHYNHYRSPGGWNGFSVLAETYNLFDAADQRRNIFLVGPQNSLETGLPINDRTGNRLVLSPTISSITAAAENEGIRVVKFPFDPAHAAEHMGNDFTIFRLAEIYLIKAEALNELNRTAEAIALVNTIRARVFNPPRPLGSMSQAAFRTAILNERLFELTTEAKRRQDLIRLGGFTAPRQFKPQTEPFRILFPIPSRQLQTNPLLVQNPGY